MIAAIIRWSVANRFLVVLAAIALAMAGVFAMRATPVDALPDLSDTQVIIRTSWPGQAPQIVENQVTYPLTTTMLSVPGAKTVRGYSFFGDSYVYVLFEDGTDLYWARSRVLEYLSQVQGRLPQGAQAALGPDATGVGWVYEYTLLDRTGRRDLSQLRSLQDWFLRYELKTLPGVAEVASIGGMVKQYQVLLDPTRLAAFGVTHTQAVDAIRRANQEAGGSVLELGEAEYMVRASGYLRTVDDFRAIPLKVAGAGVPVTLGDVASIQIGPEMRRGIAELNGEGEVAGGVVILRQGKNARQTIEAVKAKLAELKASLPPGVEIVTTYDRSQLIDRAVENLTGKLIEEFVVVAIICGLFLWHVRSALVAIVTLPLGVLAALLVMRVQGVNANIMSLGGIAIAIGAMVDAAIVMIENAHKRIERWEHDHPGVALAGEERRSRVRAGAVLQPRHHHAVVRAGVHARSAGGTAVRPARLHQELCDGGSGDPVGNARAGPDGMADPGTHSGRERQHYQPRAHPCLSPGARPRVGAALGGDRHRRPGTGDDGMAADPIGWRVHPDDG
jgi:copper/silver efflux system protein